MLVYNSRADMKQFERARALLFKQTDSALTEGWALYQYRPILRHLLSSPFTVLDNHRGGESNPRGTLWVYNEQGLGDSLFFLTRWGAYLVFESVARGLFDRIVFVVDPRIAFVARTLGVNYRSSLSVENYAPDDLHIHLGDLPHFLGVNVAPFIYHRRSPQHDLPYRIAWRSGVLDQKQIEIERIAEHFPSVPWRAVEAIQRAPTYGEQQKFQKHFPGGSLNPTLAEDCSALFDAFSVGGSYAGVSCTQAHIAAFAGAETYLFLRDKQVWYYGEGERSIFFPNAKVVYRGSSDEA